MRQILVYICFSITLQSVFGQFLLLDYSAGSLNSLFSTASSFSDKPEKNGQVCFQASDDVAKRNIESIRENNIPETDTCTGDLRFVCGSVMEHLFSPFSCPNKTILQIFVMFSYLYDGNYSDVFAIEGKINSLIIFYSEFFRIIRIGLPAIKLIYPFHNFY